MNITARYFGDFSWIHIGNLVQVFFPELQSAHIFASLGEKQETQNNKTNPHKKSQL